MNHHNATMIASLAAAKDSQSVNQPGLICPRVTDERKRREGEINEGGSDATAIKATENSTTIELQGVRKSLRILTPHFFLAWLEISGSYLVW